MILTINANAAIDHVLFVESLNPRGTIRASSAIDCIGGKGADTALALARLGAPHKLISFAAGAYGCMLEKLYKDNAIQYDLVWVEGETRMVTVIVEKESGRLTQLSHPGYSVSPVDCDRFLATARQAMAGASYCVAAGSLPAGAGTDFYQEVCSAAHNAGVPILIDSSGESLQSALSTGPEILKLNRNEFQSTFGIWCGSYEDLACRARVVLKEHRVKWMMVTLGEDGMLAVSADKALLARLPKVKPINPAGAGDAATAALVYRLALNDSIEDALRWSCAASAASVGTPVTADFSLEEASALISNVQLRAIEPACFDS